MRERLTYNGHVLGFRQEGQVRAYMECGLELRDAIAMVYGNSPSELADILGVARWRVPGIVDRAIYRYQELCDGPSEESYENDPEICVDPDPLSLYFWRLDTLGYKLTHPRRWVTSLNRN